MSYELTQTLQAALDDGCSLSDLEATFLARGDTDDRIAAAWLYAWAYDAIRPRRDDLAERISRGGTRDQTARGVRSSASRATPASPRHAHRALGRPLRLARAGSTSTPHRGTTSAPITAGHNTGRPG